MSRLSDIFDREQNYYVSRTSRRLLLADQKVEVFAVKPSRWSEREHPIERDELDIFWQERLKNGGSRPEYVCVGEKYTDGAPIFRLLIAPENSGRWDHWNSAMPPSNYTTLPLIRIGRFVGTMTRRPRTHIHQWTRFDSTHGVWYEKQKDLASFIKGRYIITTKRKIGPYQKADDPVVVFFQDEADVVMARMLIA